MFTARRKQVYEALHPETRHGGDRKSEQVAKLATCSDRFTADTAKHTGQSERVVQRDARRGERIDGEVLEEIARAPCTTAGNARMMMAPRRGVTSTPPELTRNMEMSHVTG